MRHNVRRDSKSVRLDVYVEDDKGTLYDIEMQTTDYADPAELPKRTPVLCYTGNSRRRRKCAADMESINTRRTG